MSIENSEPAIEANPVCLGYQRDGAEYHYADTVGGGPDLMRWTAPPNGIAM